ncbi:hypothetical protein AB5J55_43485 [Streptomyces sp. R11]|uniref:Uncharacterized protein n=1 Tax=Streptomyces sp. R11 TaxID=3238625 RepID=A0AB39NBW9_9ACTN
MEFIFTAPVAIAYGDLVDLPAITRRQLLIHCRNYLGEQVQDPVQALARIAEFGGESLHTYDCLHKWQVVSAKAPDKPLYDAWIDVDFGTVFDAGTLIEMPIRMVDSHFRGSGGTLHGEEIAAALDRAFAKALLDEPFLF